MTWKKTTCLFQKLGDTVNHDGKTQESLTLEIHMTEDRMFKDKYIFANRVM